MLTAEAMDADVIVIGLGPVGAALAGLLGKRGLSVIAVERDLEVFALPRAAHIDHTGLRTWQELGVLDELLPDLRENRGLDFVTVDGEVLARISNERLAPSGLPSSLYFFQPVVDQTIRDAVSALPTVDVRLGANVIDIEQSELSTIVSVETAAGLQRLSAAYVVACDGASSSARAIIGTKLTDLDLDEPWIVIDLLADPGWNASQDRALCICDPKRPVYSIPMPGDRHRFEFRLMEGEGEEMLAPEHVAELLTPWLGDTNFEVERAAIYTFHGLIADKWRERRVLIAGDAAHQMPPFLGQGMCSGLRDATNLAWKLDLVVRGGADASLLNTYESERRPHVGAIVESAVRIGRVISTVDPDEAAARDRSMLNDPRPASQRIGFRLAPLTPGPLVMRGGGDPFLQTKEDEPLDDVIGTRFAVICSDDQTAASAAATWWAHHLGAYVLSVQDLPPAASDAVRKWLDGKGVKNVIVRPDRYVMWAGDDLDEPSRAASSVLSQGAYVAEAVREDPLSIRSAT